MTDTAKTVEHALALLESLGAGGPGSSTELAQRAGLNRTVAHRLLTTLESRGFVRRRAGAWELGLGLATLGQQVERDVRVAAARALEALADETAETALLAVPDGSMAVAVEQVVAVARPVQVRYQPGFRHPLTRGAHGLAILAFSPDTLVESAVAEHGDAPRLRHRLEEIRGAGYAVTRDELELGAAGVAAPVFAGVRGPVCASLGIVTPVHRFPTGQATIAATLRAADSVTDHLTLPGAQPRT